MYVGESSVHVICNISFKECCDWALIYREIHSFLSSLIATNRTKSERGS